MVLNEGEGIAITSKNASAIGRNRLSILFSASEAVFSASGDVRSGTQYGPNETDYTGSLSVSGGSGGMSRGRVCNA